MTHPQRSRPHCQRRIKVYYRALLHDGDILQGCRLIALLAYALEYFQQVIDGTSKMLETRSGAGGGPALHVGAVIQRHGGGRKPVVVGGSAGVHGRAGVELSVRHFH